MLARQETQRINPVRANPGMFDAQFAGLNRIGGAVSELSELGFRVKNATDAAYITRSQTQMEAAQLDFQNWTKTNPDPSTWQPELDARIGETKKSVDEGAKALSPMARSRLSLVANDWETNTRKRTQLHATEKSLQVAEASFNEFVALATQNNDLQAVEAKVAEGVQGGIYHPKTAVSIVSRARQQVTLNTANTLIEADPFEAEKQLETKDDKGEHLNFSDMSPAMRQTLEFRAHKAAAQVRGNTMREWSSAMKDALDGKGPLPDREAIDEEAKHQGISPKWVANLFKVPADSFSETDYAAARREVQALDLLHDESGTSTARAVAIVTQFKGFAASELGKLVDAKMKPNDPINSPVSKFGVSSIKDMFEIGGYGEFKIPTGEYDAAGKPIKGEKPAEKQRAAVVMSRNIDLFQDWVKQHPDATHEQAQKYINGLNTEHATNRASKMIIDTGAFGFPPK